jgi:transposase
VLTLPPAAKVFVCTRPTDMRRSFDGLVGQVKEFLGEDPLAGHLFVFANKSGDRIKILWWDRDGLAIWYKRLEEGRFRFAANDTGKLEMNGADLHLVLQGIDPAKVERSKRYRCSA